MSDNIQLSADQDRALNALKKWFKSPAKYITLGGYAGTGKTTLISLLRKELASEKKNLKVAFCAYTGKATRVLKGKLQEQNASQPKDFIGTIHSLIYSPIVGSGGQIAGWELREDVNYDLIIVDEASMVDQMIWKDLTSFNAKILAVGDHGQLPPIGGNFNLMSAPILTLEEIHRQAKDNPIIEISIMAREKGEIPFGTFNSEVMKIKKHTGDSREFVEDKLELPSEDLLMLCGYNNTRIKLNQYTRQFKEVESAEPTSGDRVICLRNNHDKEIFNGMHGTIMKISDEDEDSYITQISLDGEDRPYKGMIAKAQFNNPTTLSYTLDRKKFDDVDFFDYGYAVTVHKAQGSQAPHVLLFEERFKSSTDEDWRRWLYTAVTRAERSLIIIA